MLDCGDQGRDLVPWIHSLPCEVVLPLKLRDRFEKTGAGPSMPGDARVSCRVWCRGKIHRAALEYCADLSRPAPPARLAWRLHHRSLPAGLRLLAQRAALSGGENATGSADGRAADH